VDNNIKNSIIFKTRLLYKALTHNPRFDSQDGTFWDVGIPGNLATGLVI